MLEKYLPAFFKWSSIITDDIIKTFPMLPTTDRHARHSKRAILDHSVDNVTGEKSLMWCFVLLLALFKLCSVRCDMDVNRIGIVSVVEVIGIDVGAMIDIVAAVVAAASKLLKLLCMKNAATVVAAIFHATSLEMKNKTIIDNKFIEYFWEKQHKLL